MDNDDDDDNDYHDSSTEYGSKNAFISTAQRQTLAAPTPHTPHRIQCAKHHLGNGNNLRAVPTKPNTYIYTKPQTGKNDATKNNCLRPDIISSEVKPICTILFASTCALLQRTQTAHLAVAITVCV